MFRRFSPSDFDSIAIDADDGHRQQLAREWPFLPLSSRPLPSPLNTLDYLTAFDAFAVVTALSVNEFEVLFLHVAG